MHMMYVQAIIILTELQHLKKVFHEQNDYSIWIINKVFKEFQSKQNETTLIATGNEERNNNVKHHLLVLSLALGKSKLIVLFYMM